MMVINKTIQINVLEGLRSLLENSVDCCITSPPYYLLRDYNSKPTYWPACSFNPGFGIDIPIAEWTGCLGLEPTPEMYIAHLVLIFTEVRRVLKPTGSLWLNLGDSHCGTGIGSGDSSNITLLGSKETQIEAGRRPYKNPSSMGMKNKDLMGIPWTTALALRASGWYLRIDIIWAKKSPMPESVTDRCTKSHEYLFHLTKSPHYYYDAEAIKQPIAKSTKADSRLSNPKYKPHLVDVGLPSGQLIRGNGLLKSSDTQTTANKRSVWTTDESNVWQWLFENVPQDIIAPLWEKFMHDSSNKNDIWPLGHPGFKEAHFATFPPNLIVDCIRSGTSEKGNCAQCGAPWERIIRKTSGMPDSYRGSSFNKGKTLLAQKQLHPTSVSDNLRTMTNETVGWQPTCTCNGRFIKNNCVVVPESGMTEKPTMTYESEVPISEHPLEPPIVLDTFHGGGTTGMVARKLGRNFIAYEINPDYIDMSDRRLQHELGLFV